MRGGARLNAGRKRKDARKTRLALYVEQETLDHYRALRANNVPISDHLAYEIDTQYDMMKAGRLRVAK